MQAGHLWRRLDGPGRTRMLSAGGQHTGMTWTALPDPGAKTMPDEHWRVCTAERLGLLRCPAGIPCGLPRARGKGSCGRILDRGLRHVWHCKTGAARLRIHRAVQIAFVRELRQSGGHVDIERAMPAMAVHHADGTVEESIMDLTVWWPGTTAWYGIDVTIRYAGSSRYYGSQNKPGAAAAAAEREKHRRFGRDVLLVAFEAVGRLGPESIASLQRLADAAITTAATHCVLTRQGVMAQWRRRLEAALQFAAADAVLNALSQSEGGRQTATRWCSVAPPPEPLQAYVDGLPEPDRPRPPAPESQQRGDVHATNSQLCRASDAAGCDLEAGLGDIIAADALAAELPPADLLTADEEAAWHLFGGEGLA